MYASTVLDLAKRVERRGVNCDFPRRFQTAQALHERSLSSPSLRLHNAG
jgi:hypothetical protein